MRPRIRGGRRTVLTALLSLALAAPVAAAQAQDAPSARPAAASVASTELPISTR